MFTILFLQVWKNLRFLKGSVKGEEIEKNLRVVKEFRIVSAIPAILEDFFSHTSLENMRLTREQRVLAVEVYFSNNSSKPFKKTSILRCTHLI